MLNYKRIPYKSIFLDFTGIEATLKVLGVAPEEYDSGKYTVPTIRHVPTNKYMMGSGPIARFLESTYPEPPVPLTSDLGREIELEARAAGRPAMMPLEIRILSPRAQEYFRSKCESAIWYHLEDLLNNVEQNWRTVHGEMRIFRELMRTHKADGLFVLSSRPIYTDFFIAGSL